MNLKKIFDSEKICEGIDIDDIGFYLKYQKRVPTMVHAFDINFSQDGMHNSEKK